MDSSLNNSNSEINSQNKYKFDNYGIVMVDSIEDLLYISIIYYYKFGDWGLGPIPN